MRLRIRRQHRRRRHEGAAPDPLTGTRVRQQVRAALGGKLQPALKVGAPNDAFEQEADRIADTITGRPANGMLQRQANGDTAEEKPEALTTEAAQKPNGAPEPEEEEQKNAEPAPAPEAEKLPEETVQAKAGRGGTVAPAAITQIIRSRQGRGESLPNTTRRFFESRLGTSFRVVRVHADTTAARLNEALGARAFTVGNDVFFARGAYSPESAEGRRLLAHELVHVLQQRRGLSQLQRRVVPERVSCFQKPPSWPSFAVMGVTDGQAAVAAIQAAADRAVVLLDSVIERLENIRGRIHAGEPPSRSVITDTIARELRQRLRLDPSRRRTWTERGPGTVEMIIRWYRNIRKILDGEWLYYNCLGPDCRDFDAWTNLGERRIRLCRPFWNDGLDGRAITLIHEASHIYYFTRDSGRGPGSAYCLEQFICALNSLNDVCTGCD